MAYPNYYYPNNYQPMQMPQVPLQQPTLSQNAVQNSGTGITWVLGESAAKSFPVGAGQTVVLMDREEPVMYMKSADQSGMPLPLRIFDITERTAQNRSYSSGMQNDEVVSREEFEELRSEVRRISRGVRHPEVKKEEKDNG